VKLEEGVEAEGVPYLSPLHILNIPEGEDAYTEDLG